jgi:hypothetical protein
MEKSTITPDSDHSPKILPVLTYMDKSVSRIRIMCLVLTLKRAQDQSENQSETDLDLVHFLAAASDTLNMDRLSRIISDIHAGRLFNRTDSNPVDDS